MILINTVLLLIGLSTSGMTKDLLQYDGTWWRSASQEQHRGWLAGYIDCSVINGKTDLGFVSWYTLEPAISKFYDSSPTEAHLPVGKVLTDLVAKLRQSKHGEKTHVHDGFDGDYWRQSLPDHRIGFVEGFLVCHREVSGKDTFSKPATWYVSQISTWYGVKPHDPGEINPKREDVAISTVLFRFKDPVPIDSRPK